VPLAGMIDLDAERDRLAREIDQKESFLVSVQKKLRNEQFVSRAPVDVVEKERTKERDAVAEMSRLRAALDALG
jgi:valyl-tRNA synthetase